MICGSPWVKGEKANLGAPVDFAALYPTWQGMCRGQPWDLFFPFRISSCLPVKAGQGQKVWVQNESLSVHLASRQKLIFENKRPTLASAGS